MRYSVLECVRVCLGVCYSVLECVRVCYTIRVLYSVLECVIVRVLATPVSTHLAVNMFQKHQYFSTFVFVGVFLGSKVTRS